MTTSLHQKSWQQVTRQWKKYGQDHSKAVSMNEILFLGVPRNSVVEFWCGEKLETPQEGTQAPREMMSVTLGSYCDHLNMIMAFFPRKSVNFTVMQLKESWLMFYNLYSCFDIFLTILLLLTINIFCISVYVDMCSPINVVPIFTFKMRRKNLSPPPVCLFYSHY